MRPDGSPIRKSWADGCRTSASKRTSIAGGSRAAPITPDAITADGKATLEPSSVGGLRIDKADVEGRYASQVGDLTTLNVTGPDVNVSASGRLALDRAAD